MARKESKKAKRPWTYTCYIPRREEFAEVRCFTDDFYDAETGDIEQRRAVEVSAFCASQDNKRDGGPAQLRLMAAAILRAADWLSDEP